MTYRQFTEYSEFKGEHWHFWLPIERNRAALSRLGDYLQSWADYYNQPRFYFEGRDLTEAEVDLLVEHNDNDGYFPAHTKVHGVLRLPAELEEYSPAHWFYKGGIRGLFEVTDCKVCPPNPFLPQDFQMPETTRRSLP